MNQILRQIYNERPEHIPELFAEAWNEKDAIKLANLFTEDAEFVNVVGLWWHDRKAIWKAHDYGFKNIFGEASITVRRIKTKWLSDDIALVQARMALSGQTPRGSVNQPGQRQNIISFVTRKETKGWVCVAAHNTDVVPGKETNIVDEEGNLWSVDYKGE